MIKESTGAKIFAPIPENIPERLTERPQWVCWKIEQRNDKPTKVPYAPRVDMGIRASSTDLMTWGTFSEALAAYEDTTGIFDGIGFVFSSADPFVGIDFDNCREPETGAIKPWAQKILSRVQEGYIEASPSGTGIHVVVEGKVRCSKTQRTFPPDGKIEMYGQGRFFTVTGNLL